jgi:hypothetical protein
MSHKQTNTNGGYVACILLRVLWKLDICVRYFPVLYDIVFNDSRYRLLPNWRLSAVHWLKVGRHRPDRNAHGLGFPLCSVDRRIWTGKWQLARGTIAWPGIWTMMGTWYVSVLTSWRKSALDPAGLEPMIFYMRGKLLTGNRLVGAV